MKKSLIILFLLLNLFVTQTFAWCCINRPCYLYFMSPYCSLNPFCVCSPWYHSIEIGYGWSRDPNHTRYSNYGGLLTADLVPLYRSYHMFWTINAGIGRWKTNTPIHKNLTTTAVALALRFYPYYGCNYAPYLFGSFGPAYFSDKHFGFNDQAYKWGFQTNLGLGTEIHAFDVNFRLTHYSNGGIKVPNDGYNILYLLSVGYLF